MLIFEATLRTQITTARTKKPFFFEFSYLFTKAEIFYLYILHKIFEIDINALVKKNVQSKQVCKLAFHIKILAFIMIYVVL